MASIYFNANCNPAYYYPLIKPLAIIYDRIYLWSPVASRLGAAGFDASDFLHACTSLGNQPAVIVPVARDTWFDGAQRSLSPDPDFRRFDSSFECRIQAAAEHASRLLRHETILSSSEKTEAASKASTIAVQPGLLESMAALAHGFDENSLLRVQANAEQYGQSLAWGILMHFITDLMAISHLKGAVPLVRMDHAQGYFLGSQEPRSETLEPTVLGRRMTSGEELPGYDNITAKDIVQFLNNISNAQHLSWKQVLEVRADKGILLREWLDKVVNRRRVTSVADLDSVALASAKVLLEHGRGALYASAGVGSAAATWVISGATGMDLWGFLGHLIAAGVGAPVILKLLDGLRLSTAVSASFAGRLPWGDRVFIDTPYFERAKLEVASSS